MERERRKPQEFPQGPKTHEDGEHHRALFRDEGEWRASIHSVLRKPVATHEAYAVSTTRNAICQPSGHCGAHIDLDTVSKCIAPASSRRTIRILQWLAAMIIAITSIMHMALRS